MTYFFWSIFYYIHPEYMNKENNLCINNNIFLRSPSNFIGKKIWKPMLFDTIKFKMKYTWFQSKITIKMIVSIYFWFTDVITITAFDTCWESFKMHFSVFFLCCVYCQIFYENTCLVPLKKLKEFYFYKVCIFSFKHSYKSINFSIKRTQMLKKNYYFFLFVFFHTITIIWCSFTLFTSLHFMTKVCLLHYKS